MEIPDAIVEQFISYENNSLDEDETISFFQMLIDTGLYKQLQGKYERIAKQFIMAGLCVSKQQLNQLNLLSKVA